MAVVELGAVACSPLTSHACQPECLALYPWSSWPQRQNAGHSLGWSKEPGVRRQETWGSDLTLTTASFVSWASPFPSLGLSFPHL